MYTENLQLLIDNKLKNPKREELINLIKNNSKVKQEFALLMNIRDIGREKIKTKIEDSDFSKKESIGIAKYSLTEIRRAAFGQNTKNDDLTSLPIKDQTLDDFLTEDE